MAGPRLARWGIAIVLVAAVALMVLGAMAIVLGLVGGMSSGTGGSG